MQEPIRKYKIVKGTTHDELSEEVNDILVKDEGWQPEGPFVIFEIKGHYPPSVLRYHQVMTKRRRLPE